MSGSFFAGCLAGLFVLGVSEPVWAQMEPSRQGRDASEALPAALLELTRDSLGSYDASALRVETHMGEFQIVRGLNGPIVGKIGMFSRPDMASLVAPSERAMIEGREFNRNYRPGMAAGLTGMVIFATSVAASSIAGTNWGWSAATVGGGALMVYGAVRLDKAYSALSKSIWWYNRDLKK
jgi:hypothetical protein